MLAERGLSTTPMGPPDGHVAPGSCAAGVSDLWRIPSQPFERTAAAAIVALRLCGSRVLNKHEKILALRRSNRAVRDFRELIPLFIVVIH